MLEFLDFYWYSALLHWWMYGAWIDLCRSPEAKLRLSCNDEEHVDFQTIVQDVCLRKHPYMTPRATFVINGAERWWSPAAPVPGVFSDSRVNPNGTKIYSARVILQVRGWICHWHQQCDVCYIDRTEKFPVTLMRSIGFETDKISLELFGMADEVKAEKKQLDKFLGKKLAARVLRTWVEDFVVRIQAKWFQ